MIITTEVIEIMRTITEVDRKNLVGKTKAQSLSRYNKRLKYHVKGFSGIDPSRLLNDDMLVTEVQVGDYNCVVAYKGLLDKLIKVVDAQPRHNVTLQSVIRAVNQSIDNVDLLVDCECSDWRYRYAFVATKHGYKWGKPETRPSNITNPDDNIGAMCKHLTMLLANKRWLVKLSSIVNDFVKANIEDIRKKFKIDEEQFFVNEPGRPSIKTGRNTRMRPKSDDVDNSSDNKDESDNEQR